MGTQLSSLKVDASLDSSGWVQGANQLAAANAKAIDSTNQLSAAIDATNQKLSSSQFINGNGAANQFQQQVQQIQQAQDAASSSSSGWLSSLNDLATVAAIAGKAILFLSTTGIGEMTAMGGAFALAGTQFQNSVAQNITTGAADILVALATPLKAFAAIGLAVEALNAVTALGATEMSNLASIAGKAQAAGVAPSFFQQWTQGADDVGSSADNATTALNNFFKATQPSGTSGSTLDQTLKTLEQAGNFQGNSGVGEYNQATTTEQKYQAVVDLITQAMTAGQRLAALDLAKTFLPDSMMQNLRAVPDFLQEWAQDSKDVTPPFSDADVALAAQMNSELSDAEDTLSNKFQPILTDLSAIGLQFEYSWIQTVELMAEASGAIAVVYSELKELTGASIGSGALYDLVNLVPILSGVENAYSGVKALLNMAVPAEWMQPVNLGAMEISAGLPSAQTANVPNAVAQLGSGLSASSTTPAVSSAELAATTQEYAVLGDTTKNLTNNTDALRDAFDRLTTSLEKTSLSNQAQIDTIGQSAAATAGLKAEYDLLEASMNSGSGVTLQQISEYTTLRQTMSAHQAMLLSGIELNQQAAGAFDTLTNNIVATTTALEKAKADEAINFSGGLLGLNDNDVAIVNQLKPLFGDDIPAALNSSEAAALRFQQEITSWKGYAADFTSTLLSGLQQGLDSGKAIGSALVSAANQFASAMGKQGTSSITGALAGVANSVYNGGNLTSALTSTSTLSSIGSGLTSFGIGTVVSFITGSISASEQAQQQWQQAQNAWANMATEVSNWSNQMTTGGNGSLTSALDQSEQQAQQYADAAHAAGQSADEINQALATFADREVGDFIASFDTMIGALNSGLGYNSPAVTAAQNVQSIGTQLEGFIQDTVTASNLIGGNSTAIQTATAASQSYALSLLQTPPTLDTIETSFATLMGTATQLQSVLQDLGMTSAQAASAIQSGVTEAIASLQVSFTQTLQQQINTAQGNDWINSLQSLESSSGQSLLDANMLGVDPSLVAESFQAQAQAIVDSAGLTGTAFQQLITLFPELTGVVTQSTTAVANEITYYQNLQTTITSYLASLDTGSLSPLSPQAQLASAQSTWQTQLALAQSGNQDALNSITSNASSYLTAAQSYYASGSGYTDVYNQVEQALENLVPTAEANDPLMQIATNTATTNQILTVLQTLNASTSTSTTTIAAAIQALGSLTADVANGQASSFFGPMTSYLSQIAANTATIGAAASNPPNNNLEDLADGDWNKIQIHWRRGGLLPTFAAGGVVGNGLWDIDSVRARYANGGDIMLAGGEFVVRAPSVMNNLAALQHINRTGRVPSNDGANFQQIASVISQAIAGGAMAQISALTDGLSEVTDRLDQLTRATKAQKRPVRPGKAA